MSRGQRRTTRLILRLSPRRTIDDPSSLVTALVPLPESTVLLLFCRGSRFGAPLAPPSHDDVSRLLPPHGGLDHGFQTTREAVCVCVCFQSLTPEDGPTGERGPAAAEAPIHRRNDGGGGNHRHGEEVSQPIIAHLRRNKKMAANCTSPRCGTRTPRIIDADSEQGQATLHQ